MQASFNLVVSHFYKLSVVISFVGLIGCSVKSEVAEQDPASIKGQVPPTEVKVVEAKLKPFEYLITTNGKVEAEKEVEIKFKVDGILSHVNVKNGDHVPAGQLLATVENYKYKLDLDKAEIQLKEKQLTYKDQIIGYESHGEEKQKVIYANIRFSSGLAAAENNYEQAKYAYENSLLKSPITGILSNLTLKDGSTAKLGETLCSIHKPDELLITCEILEADAFIISKGQEAIVQPLFEKERKYKSMVALINPRVDVKTGLVNIKLSVINPVRLFPGMNVSITIKVPTENNIVVPKEAVVMRSGKQVVFTEENGLAKWNYVTVGRENGEEIEIKDGLKENSKVIITNNLQLAHDAPVKAF